MLFLDGVYVTTSDRLTFRRVPPPTAQALEKLIRGISERVGRALERLGLLVRDLENSFLTPDSPDGAGFDDLLGHSITYRVALGPHQGRKAFTLQAVPAATDAIDGKLARATGFSLHAGVACEAHEREKLERLCRYITRPAVSTERLSLTAQGNIRYRLKTPYRDGTTDVVFEPLDKIAWSDFEQPQAGPQGEGQDARSTLSPGLPRWCRRHGSTSRVLMRAFHGAPPAGALRASKFTPGEFVTGSLRRTTDCVSK